MVGGGLSVWQRLIAGNPQGRCRAIVAISHATFHVQARHVTCLLYNSDSLAVNHGQRKFSTNFANFDRRGEKQ